MSADFGANLDAALSGHLQAIQDAADAAKGRIDEALAGVPVEPDSVFASAPALDFPMPGVPAQHAAAVDFSLEEPSTEGGSVLDEDGIPMPEEI